MGVLDAFDAVPGPAASPSGPPTGFFDNAAAAFKSFGAFGKPTARRDYTMDAWSPVIDRLNALGVRKREPGLFGSDVLTWSRPLRNPALAQVEQSDPAGVIANASDDTADIWAAAAADPAWPKGLPRNQTELEAQVAAQRKAAMASASDVESRATTAGSVGGFVGGIGAGFTDPLILYTLPLGGGETIAASLARRTLINAAKNGILAAGVTAFEQPLLMADAPSVGIDYSAGDAVKATGMGLLTGAAFGAGHTLGGAGFKAVAGSAPVRAAADFAGRKGTRLLLKTIGAIKDKPLDVSDAETVLRHAADIADLSPFKPTPQGDAEHAHRFGAVADAQARGEPLPEFTPPDPALLRPGASAPAAVAIGRDLPPGEIEAALRAAPNLNAHNPHEPLVYGIEVDPRAVGVDAAKMQFKAGGNDQGVTDRLKNVQGFDRVLAGRTMIWQANDGRMWIADGHQRHGLAMRALDADPSATVTMDAALYREADGYSAQDMRVIAARKNLAEGSGTAVDAAKIFRARPDAARNLPETADSVVAHGRALAQLSDQAFAMVVNGQVPANYAAAVGRLLPDRAAEHASVLAAIARSDLASVAQVESFVRLAADAPAHAEVQHGLFGAETLMQNLVVEKAKLLDTAMRRIVTDKKISQMLVDERTRIEAAGNQLDTAANKERAVNAQQLGAAIEALAYRPGPVSDALGNAARLYASGGRTPAALRGATGDFLDHLPPVGQLLSGAADAIDGDGRPGGALGRGGGAAEADGAVPGEHGGAADAGTRRQLDGFADPHGGEGPKAQVQSIEHDLRAEIVRTGPAQPTSIDEIYRAAPANAKTLDLAGKAVAGPGLEWVDGGIKNRATAEAKIPRKKYASAAGLTDVVRGALIVDDDAAVAPAIARLGEKLNVNDEGWKTTSAGYTDRKVLVRFADGNVGEIQFVRRPMFEAKKSAGDALFNERRALDKNDPQYLALLAREQALYADAAIKASISGENGGGENLARQSASAMTPAELDTSAASTSDHSGRGAPKAKAPTPPGPAMNTEGRLSQSPNETRAAINDPLDPNVSPNNPLDNGAAVDPAIDLADTGLFGQVDMFAVDDSGAMHSAADLLKGIDDEIAQLKKLRGCTE